MQSLKTKVLLVQNLIFGLIFGFAAHGAVLISVNNAAPGVDLIPTFDFTLGQMVNSFVPDGATNFISGAATSGRAIAIQSNEVFYTEVFIGGSSAPSDGIHVAPYGTDGYGGHDIRVLPNPRTNNGIQGLAFHNDELYALTGYGTNQLEVFGLDPTTGSVISGPINIASPAQPDSDGFLVLTNGNFLINDGDESTIYREYNGTTGNLVSGGLFIDLSTLSPGFDIGTGACLAPDGQSLYFCAAFETIPKSGSLIQTDLAGHLLDERGVGGVAFEELAVVETPSCSVYPRFDSMESSNFSFVVFSPNGIVWNVYSSTNLTNWTLLTTTSGGYPEGITDSTISGVPYRFYKLSDSNCCSQAIGFVRIPVQAGTTNHPGTNSLLANQLDSPAGNTLDGLFNVNGSSAMADGTALIDGSVIEKWDFASQSFLYYTWNSSTGWLDANGNHAGSVSLEPGEGAFLATSNAITTTFVGLVPEGNLNTPLTQPSKFYLLSAQLPEAGGLQSGLSYTPHVGDLVDTWNGTGYDSSQYIPFSGAHWWPQEPILNVGQGFFWRGVTNNTWYMSFSACQ